MKKGILIFLFVSVNFLFASAAAVLGVTEVIDNGVNLLITEEDGDKTNFDKQGAVLNVSGAFLFLTNNQGRQYRLDFTIITSPSVGSAELLRVAIDAFLQTGGVLPVGGATSTLQATGNDLLVDIDASLNNIEAVDFATEVTLASVDSRLAILGGTISTEATLQTLGNISATPTVNTINARLQSILEEIQEINATSTLPAERGFLGDAGLNSGSISPIGDFSVTPDDFFYEIPSGKTFLLKTLVIYIEDGNNSFQSGDYGGISALTNGIDILISIDGVESSILAGVFIKKNTDFSKHGSPLVPLTFGTGNESGMSKVNIVELAGVMIPLNGDNTTPDRIIVRVNDDFSGLIDHSFKVLGPLIDN